MKRAAAKSGNVRARKILPVWILLAVACSYSQEPESGIVRQWFSVTGTAISADARYCGENVLHLIQSPLKMNKATYSVAGSLLGITILGLAADEHLRHEALEGNSRDMDKLILPWRYYGESYIPIGVAASCYVGGLGFSNNWLRETGRECMMSLVVSGVICKGLKVVIGRERPYANEGAFDLDPFSFHSENNAFPSGHTTAAFALSSILAARIRNPFAAVALYSAACMTAVQRVYSDKHWFTDVIGGAIVGTFSGLFIFHDSSKMMKQTKHSSFRLAPLVTPQGAGIGVVQSF